MYSATQKKTASPGVSLGVMDFFPLPAASAHPPGVLKGLIFGLPRKYR
jgi:hypothetical protein